ncbi:hypothetical protein N7520_003340 [Penicillium odoratum]|uniref:uncharacterized protein n=1 Tax=Penicillium odoratum TaxID=1167516 RepID=UPI002546F1E6|nr:uncharacterized protein N7520_003340 [Penicillium odoratum]KAJ5768781.1 hypothetical protein N7520_003340 [Penicillium odoratum]
MWVFNATDEVEAVSQYKLILAVCLTFTSLMVIVVSLRLFLRAKANRLLAADYVIFVSMIFSIIYSALCIAQSRYGLGLPLALRPKADLATYTKVNYAGRPFYQLGIAGFKASLCLSYLSLLVGTSKHIYRSLIWVVIFLSTGGHIAGTLVLLLSCTPVKRAWDITAHGTCFPIGPTFYGLAIYTIFCDLMIIFLPIPLLIKLNIKRAQKIGVLCLFLLGLFTTICSILRLTQIHRVAFGDGNSTALILWGTVEFNIGNIMASVPYLTPLLKGVVRDFRSRREYDSQGNPMESWVQSVSSPTKRGFPQSPTKRGIPQSPTKRGFPQSPTNRAFPPSPAKQGFVDLESEEVIERVISFQVSRD